LPRLRSITIFLPIPLAVVLRRRRNLPRADRAGKHHCRESRRDSMHDAFLVRSSVTVDVECKGRSPPGVGVQPPIVLQP
jgi:hypothetical protein